MLNVIARFRALLRDDKGQDLIEYALLAGLIALVAVVGHHQRGNPSQPRVGEHRHGAHGRSLTSSETSGTSPVVSDCVARGDAVDASPVSRRRTAWR